MLVKASSLANVKFIEKDKAFSQIGIIMSFFRRPFFTVKVFSSFFSLHLVGREAYLGPSQTSLMKLLQNK